MICEFCGNQVPDDAAVCTFCNAKLSTGAPAAQAAPAQPVESPMAAQASPAASPAPASAQPAGGPMGAQPVPAGGPMAQPAPAGGPMVQPAPTGDPMGAQPAPAGSPIAAPVSPSQGPAVAASVPSAASQAASTAPAASPATAATPAASPAAVAQAARSRLPIIIGAAAVIVIVIIAFFMFGGRGSTAPKAATEAMNDAAAVAAELAERYEGFKASAEGSSANESAGESAGETQTTETRTYDKASGEIQDGMDRLQTDIDALKGAGQNWKGYDQALAAMENLQSALKYEKDTLEAQNNASAASEGTGYMGALTSLAALYDNYEAIVPPDCLKDYLSNTIKTLPTILSALYYNVANPSSTLTEYTSKELLTWWFTKQNAYDAECNDILISQCKESREMLESLASGKEVPSKPKVNVDMINEISPNLYPSLDAAAILGVTAYDGSHSIAVEAEIVGLTQKFEQKFDLAQGYNYLSIKPALLSSKDLPNLTANTTTQLNIKVTDASNGEVLAQESHQVNLNSIYDFKWTNDEFGKTATFDILAWLRPQADEVNAVNRAAADILGNWTGGSTRSLTGYLSGDNPLNTLIQVAAIQKAISDKGVVYVMDSYSFASDQHVLTPDAVVKKQQGLCIETSLLMSSCLMSAGMHPLIIITPGHAQVAVETYSGSGNYFLIETTKLPYPGVDTSLEPSNPAFYSGLLPAAKTQSGELYYWTTSGSSDEWKTYLDYKTNSNMPFGGIFVIDCNLQQVMDIQGLENI